MKTAVDAFDGTSQRDRVVLCTDFHPVNVILVVGHEKLNVEMQRAFGSSLTVLKVPKSGGVRPSHLTRLLFDI